MNRLQQIFRAAKDLKLSKNQAQILVGGRGRLERLEREGKIRVVKTGDRQNARWECNGADALRYAVVKGEIPYSNYEEEQYQLKIYRNESDRKN